MQLSFFLKEIWPKVLAVRPSTTLCCVGSICSDPSLRSHPNVTLLGFVENLDAVYDKAELVINPVRIGQGVKVKVVEALARGCIVLTTSNGAAGIHYKSEEFLVVDDEPKVWVDKILAYLQKKDDLQDIRSAALEFSKNRFGNEVVFEAIVNWLHSSDFKKSLTIDEVLALCYFWAFKSSPQWQVETCPPDSQRFSSHQVPALFKKLKK